MSVRELNIIAVYTDARHKEVWKRRYMTIDSALARATFELGSKGKPKDTVTFSHAVTSKYLGFMRVHAGGKFTGERVWEKPETLTVEAVKELAAFVDNLVAAKTKSNANFAVER